MASRTKIFGIGVNDADYITAPKIGGKQVVCPIYNVWKAMLARCYSKKAQIKQRTYHDCSVSDEWLYFSNFSKWHIENHSGDLNLDKDILVFGNKVYSKETCVYVPRFVNNCFRSPCGGSHSGGLLLGVSAPEKMKESPRPYMACISSPTKKTHHLGHFSSQIDAHRAWQKVKVEKIFETAREYEAHESFRPDVLKAIYERADRILSAISSGDVTVVV